LQLNGFIQLVDAADNSPGAGAETLYVDSLIVSSGASLDLNGRKLYARAVELQGTGTIIGGTATIVPDGGPILYALPTSGKISVSGEQDNWTFFGRANQTVSVVMNPSGPTTPGSPAPINPVLGQGRLTLLSPTAELGSVQGGVSTLADITLPVDGTYTLRMRAPLTDPTRTGVYNLALYNVTVETRPLLLNAITAGNIETPFSRNRWTFSLDAGQQIQFDLIAAVTSGLQFTLEGPDGFVAFNNITDDSTLITVPGGKTGNYVLTAKGQTDQTGAYGFIIRDGSITPLTLGTPFAGVLPGSGSPRWFKATLPNVGQLLVTLDDSNNNDRTRSTCGMANCRCATSSSSAFQGYAADGQIYVPNAVAGDWYILVYGDHVPAPSSYTLKAEYSDLRITSITPDRYGVNNTMTMTLSGGGFEPGTSVQADLGRDGDQHDEHRNQFLHANHRHVQPHRRAAGHVRRARRERSAQFHPTRRFPHAAQRAGAPGNEAEHARRPDAYQRHQLQRRICKHRQRRDARASDDRTERRPRRRRASHPLARSDPNLRDLLGYHAAPWNQRARDDAR
jgi:hypothetical protein